MNPFKREEHSHRVDRELLYMILENQFLLFTQNQKIMSDAVDLQTMLDQVLAKQAEQKTSLDAMKLGIATIVGNIPAGGLTADETAALKLKVQAVLDGENANAAEAADDAAAVAAALPATPPTGEAAA